MSAADLQLARLHEEFIEGFSLASQARTEELERFLLIRSANQPIAVRVAEISGLELIKKVTPVPMAEARLSGLIGVRGRVVPVFDLAAVLGLSTGHHGKWALLVGALGSVDEVALAVDGYDGYVELPPRELLSMAQGSETSRHVNRWLRTTDGTRGIVNLSVVVKDALGRDAQGGPFI